MAVRNEIYYEMIDAMRKSKKRMQKDKKIIQIVHKMMHKKKISDKDIEYIRTNKNS